MVSVKQNGEGTKVKLFGQELTVHDRKSGSVIAVLLFFVCIFAIASASGWIAPKLLNREYEIKAEELGTVTENERFKIFTEEKLKICDENKGRIDILEKDITEIKIGVAETNGEIKTLAKDIEYIKEGIREIRK